MFSICLKRSLTGSNAFSGLDFDGQQNADNNHHQQQPHHHDDKSCDGIVCENGGSCLKGTCICDEGYSGPRCKTDDCRAKDCNGGSCSKGKCICLAGLTGEKCEKKTGCDRPAGWCSHANSEYYRGKCNGQDGIACRDYDGKRWTILSKDSCKPLTDGNASIESCPEFFTSDCRPPTGWCSHPGSEYYEGPCNGKQGIACRDTNGKRWTALSKDGCKGVNENAPIESCPEFFGKASPAACQRPAHWCSHPNSEFYRGKCNGQDGIACRDYDGKRWTILSKDSCKPLTDGDALIESCPEFFKSACRPPTAWCSHPGSEYYGGPCNGEQGIACKDTSGKRWTRLSKNGCKGVNDNAPKDSCPEFFGTGCDRPSIWCTHAGAEFYRGKCNGVDGLACKDKEGNRWTILPKDHCQTTQNNAAVDSCPEFFKEGN